MRNGAKRTGLRFMKIFFLAIFLVVCLLIGISVLSNFLLSSHSPEVGYLSELDKSRISETYHLLHTFGNSLWPGWGNAYIPVIIYNEEYAFLGGYQNPPPGWIKVPQNINYGTSWELVPDDTLGNQPYYRQHLADGITPQAFTVRVGEKWTASMTTRDWMVIGIGNELRDGFPPVLKYIIPYRFISKFVTGNTDQYLAALVHECFHAYQGLIARDRLESAETVLGKVGSRYPWGDESFNKSWKAELNLLADALSVKNDSARIELTGRFLTQRRERRQACSLDPDLVNLERLREWEEGLAKYTELAIWQMAGKDTTYCSVAAIQNDPDFYNYTTYRKQWAQEVTTIRFQVWGDEIRFYYSGMALAFLLDRLHPGWKDRILQDNVFLEDLLSEAVQSNLK